MSDETQEGPKGTCFVVMGFGKKTDFESGRTLDLDKTYRTIIKPAVMDAGLECVRADEIVHSGLIDVPMYEQLLSADVVVADISTSNKNAFYELGVRHALRPATTIVICEDGVKTAPFDVNHVSIKKYHHLGDGIDFEEVERFRRLLTETIREIYAKQPRPSDSPVYAFLENLSPPERRAAIKGMAEVAAFAAPGAPAPDDGGEMHSALMEQVEEAQDEGDFLTAKALLTRLRKKMKGGDPNKAEDPYIVQRLALVTYKSGHPTPRAALEEARELLLLLLDPATSNDTETLGLWGAVNKRLWALTKDPAHLDDAVRGYERGFCLRNDYYNGINLAYLLNVRAANAASRAEAVADFVQAGRVRREVLEICERELQNPTLTGDKRYWVLATLAEARLGSGDEAGAQQALGEAFGAAPYDWMKESTEAQMDKLRALLADSPLRYVADGAA